MKKFSGFTTINEAYAHYLRLLGDANPDDVRSKDELRDKIHEADLSYEEIDQAFWNSLFEGDQPWAYGPYPEEWRSEEVTLLREINTRLTRIEAKLDELLELARASA